MAHAGAMRQFIHYARATGLDLDAILDADLRAILAVSATAERVPAHAIVDMLQICAATAARPDIGIALAAWSNLRGYGPLSLLWDHCPTLAEAMRVNRRYLHLESGALGTVLLDESEEMAQRHILAIPARFGGTQFLEATLTLELRVMRMILGEDWAPVRLELDRPAPANTRFHRAVFRCPIEFGADRNAIILRRDDLARPSHGRGDAHMLAYLERLLGETATPLPDAPIRQVERIIAGELAGGRATLALVAERLAMSPRSLQRRLETESETFASVLESVRRRIAEDYFHTESRPCLTRLAHRLGYGDASAASRFLRTKLSSSARALRGSGPP